MVSTLALSKTIPPRIRFHALSPGIILAGLITRVLAVTLILPCVRQDWLITHIVKHDEQYVNNPRLLDDEKSAAAARDS